MYECCLVAAGKQSIHKTAGQSVMSVNKVPSHQSDISENRQSLPRISIYPAFRQDFTEKCQKAPNHI